MVALADDDHGNPYMMVGFQVTRFVVSRRCISLSQMADVGDLRP